MIGLYNLLAVGAGVFELLGFTGTVEVPPHAPQVLGDPKAAVVLAHNLQAQTGETCLTLCQGEPYHQGRHQLGRVAGSQGHPWHCTFEGWHSGEGVERSGTCGRALCWAGLLGRGMLRGTELREERGKEQGFAVGMKRKVGAWGCQGKEKGMVLGCPWLA